MLTESELLRQFEAEGLLSGGELFLPKDAALRFIEICHSNDFAVIGIEGFLLKDGELMPLLDLIADYSSANSDTWETYKRLCNENAVSFFKDAPSRPDWRFTFTVMSRQEWKSIHSPRMSQNSR